MAKKKVNPYEDGDDAKFVKAPERKRKSKQIKRSGHATPSGTSSGRVSNFKGYAKKGIVSKEQRESMHKKLHPKKYSK